MTEKSTELVRILNEQGLDESNSKAIIEAFGGPFEEAGVILSTYQTIKVTDESDVAGMAAAKEARLVLKRARTTAENGRKELKADILKQGRAIDNVARFVKETIEPAETYLKQQEDFAKLAQEKRDAEKKAARLEQLRGFEVDTSIYNIDLMTDEAFDLLIANLKVEADRVQKEQLATEMKAVEAAEAERKRQAEIEAENARLKKEADEKEKRNAIVRDRINKVTALGLIWDESIVAYVRNEIRVTPEHLKEYTDDAFSQMLDHITFTIGEELRIENEKQAKLKADEEAKIAAERAQAETDRVERQRLQKESDDRAAAEAKEKADREAAEHAALVAPDKDKVKNYIEHLVKVCADDTPAVQTLESMKILQEMQTSMNALIKTAREQLEKL